MAARGNKGQYEDAQSELQRERNRRLALEARLAVLEQQQQQQHPTPLPNSPHYAAAPPPQMYATPTYDPRTGGYSYQTASSPMQRTAVPANSAYERYVTAAEPYMPVQQLHPPQPSGRPSYEIQAPMAPPPPPPLADPSVLARLHAAESAIAALVGRCEALEMKCGALEKQQLATPSPPSTFATIPLPGQSTSDSTAVRPPSMDHRGGFATSVTIAAPVKQEVPARAAPSYGALPGGRKPRGGAKAAATAAAAEPSGRPPRAPNASKSSEHGPSAERFVVQHLGQVLPFHGDSSKGSVSTAASHVLGVPNSAAVAASASRKVRAPSPSTLTGAADARSIHAYQQRQLIAASAAKPEPRGLSSRSSSWQNANTTQSPAPNDPLSGPEGYRGFTVSMLAEDEARYVADVIRRLGRQAELISVPTDQDLPDTVTHVVVRDKPVSRKALCALVSGRTVVTLEYMRQSLSLGTWVDETQVNSAYRCFPQWPIEKKKVIVAVPDSYMATSIRDVLVAGRAVVLDDNARGRGDVLILSSAEDLTSYIEQFY